MSYARRGQMLLDYQAVAYPGSVLQFRGPEQDLDEPYILCLGGSETFGRFIHAPFAAQLHTALPVKVINMGVRNAGLEVLMHDPVLTAATARASAVVLQIVGAQNMNNRYYTVHPRRNDRFVEASATLRRLYRDVDFTEFHFVRHMLGRLRDVSQDRFHLVETELRMAWVARMKSLLAQSRVPVHLLWLSRRTPDDGAKGRDLGFDPLFVDHRMVEDVAAFAASICIAAMPGSRATPPTKGMFFSHLEERAARALPGPDAHAAAATALLPHLTGKRT